MRIDRTVTDECVLLAIEGRIDASWSDAAAAALEEAIRSGRARIELDLAAVTFISSVGIGVIVRANARFRSVKGVLAIVAASEGVRDMLRISKLDFLVQKSAIEESAAKESAAQAAGLQGAGGGPRAGAVRAKLPFGEGWIGELEPTATPAARASAAYLRSGTITLDAGTIAIGHFALAGGERDAEGHFGEGIATGGTVAVAPAGAPRPDCLVSSADGSAPERFVRFIARDALVVRGHPALRGTFERTPITRLPLRSLAQALCEVADSAVAFTAIGECDGALGAWARVSPDAWKRPVSAMDDGELRTNLRFAGEPMHAGESLAVVAIACLPEHVATLPPEIVANLADSGPLLMHAHAATVSYRPVPRNTTDILATGTLLAEQPLRSVMHCMHLGDTTPQAVETAFVRGSLWAMRIGGNP